MEQKTKHSPVLLVVMDGVGLSSNARGNALAHAHIPFLRRAISNYKALSLRASGTAVGIPDGVMGNSEVGHIALGSGQIIRQGIEEINSAFESGAVFESKSWKEAISRCKNNENATLHFSGILSDGGVHSDISHLEKMIREAHKEGINKIRIHPVYDGRDVAPRSAETYILRIESFLATFTDSDYRIADGGGRMCYVADRYESDWGMVKLGWDNFFFGNSSRRYTSSLEAIKDLRRKDPSLNDQYLPDFVIVDEDDDPVGLVSEGDSFIYFDFRADRAIEIAMAFTYEDFPFFDRGFENNRRPDVYFVGMNEYNSDTHVPEHRLIEKTKIENTLNRFLSDHGLSQYAVSETVKFGHITYYFNGNSYEKARGEVHEEIESFSRPFDECPWMKSAEIADKIIENLDKFDFLRCNFPGGDMVGHFGEMEPTVIALEAIDLALSRIAKKLDSLGGMMIITADHGNCEELVNSDGTKKTSHTTNRVPCIFYDNSGNMDRFHLVDFRNIKLKKLDIGNNQSAPGIANIAATIATIFDLEEDIPDSWQSSLIEL